MHHLRSSDARTCHVPPILRHATAASGMHLPLRHARVCSLAQANPTIGLVMFASFTIFLMFIFANLIIAILMDAYSKIRTNEQLEKAGRDLTLTLT